MKRAVILFVAAMLCLPSYGQSLRAIRDSLEVHYGFASVQSCDEGIWFLVGVPGEAEAKAQKFKDASLFLSHDGKPYSWIRPGKSFKSSYKLGACDISGREIIAPTDKPFEQPNNAEAFFKFEDGTRIDFDGSVIEPADEEGNKILEEYLKEISDELKFCRNDKYLVREFIGRKADTLTVYSIKGEILSQIVDSSVVDFRIFDGVISLKYDSEEMAFYDYYGREIFPKGKYDKVTQCWFGYQVYKKGYGYGVVSFDGKELISGKPGEIFSHRGCFAERGKNSMSNENFYRFDGSFICNRAAINYEDGRISIFDVGSCCTVLQNKEGTRYAIIDSFGDYILPFTEVSVVFYNAKQHSYELDSKQNALGNKRRISLGINQFGRVFAEPEERNKFGYHLLNGVLGLFGGLAVVATAGTALIGGISPNATYTGNNNPQYVQTDTYIGGETANRVSSSQSVPMDGITGSNFQNYERSYDGYASTLSKMYYGQYLYSDSERSNIQREMRNIREKVNGQNQRRKIAQSSWETWSGSSKYLKMK